MRTHVPVQTSAVNERHTFQLDWFGKPDPHDAAYRLSVHDGLLSLEFWANKSAECNTALRSGDFGEGLWEQDVAELFVMGPDGHYQEFNLSPTGAWWSATFSSYREGCLPAKLPSVHTEARREEGRWNARLSLALSDLKVLSGLDIKAARLNVTSILSPRDPSYLCWGWQKGNQPDFHRADNFLPIALV